MAHPLHWLWCTPRSVSTALERCLLGVAGLRAEHEPYTDTYYFGSARRSDRYGARPVDAPPAPEADEVGRRLARLRARSPLLVKELAFQGEPYVTDAALAGSRSVILSRRPSRVYASLVRLKPDFTAEEIGYDALLRIVRRLEALDAPRLFVDGDELQGRPAETVRRVCRFLELPFSESLLSWEDGAVRRWARHERASQAVWHGTLEASTGLVRTHAPAVPVAAGHRALLNRCERIYLELARRCPKRDARAEAV